MSYSIFDETMVDLPWPAIEKAAEEGAVILLPTGVIEEHGPHMGLGVDICCSHLLCKLVKRKLKDKGRGALISPPFYWGINNATGSFPGSFSVGKNTLKAVLHDILASLKRWGFEYVFNVNWHGDQEHIRGILEAVEEARIDTGVRAYCIVQSFDVGRLGLAGHEPHVLVQEGAGLEKKDSEYLEIHADSLETGIMMRYFPGHVDGELAGKLKPTELGFEDLTVWRQGWNDARGVTPLGYFGNPADFDPQAAERFMETSAGGIAGLIAKFLTGRRGETQTILQGKG
jgi:creatinine amidohydrolase